MLTHAFRGCNVVICFGLLFLFGCVSTLKSDLGAVARKEARISLSDDIPAGVLANDDIRITYTLVRKGEDISLTGKIVFDRSITDSFTAIKSFSLYLSFLDSESKVIETVDISPVINTYGATPDSLVLKFSGVRPPGSKAMAFHYSGGFISNGKHEGGQWDIQYFPFNRAQ